MKRRTILFFVFDGFTDWETSYALTGIMMSDLYRVKTIALTREGVRSSSGLTVFPDLDFFPETDLADIDILTTAMLILPSGYVAHGDHATVVDVLLAHCFRHHIPVAMFDNTIRQSDNNVAMFNMATDISGSNLLSMNLSPNSIECDKSSVDVLDVRGQTPIAFASAVFDKLNISDDAALGTWFTNITAVEVEHKYGNVI